VTVLAILLATVVVTVIGVAAPGGAQAANHGRVGAGYAGMHQIVVRPGQTLWSVAAQAEPSADPRLVISQIMTANSMTSTVVQAGQLLWVPK
jgi:Tfp pilus assembly protein FimV